MHMPQLLCHVQNFVAIALSETRWEQNEYSNQIWIIAIAKGVHETGLSAVSMSKKGVQLKEFLQNKSANTGLNTIPSALFCYANV